MRYNAQSFEETSLEMLPAPISLGRIEQASSKIGWLI
jgi:hypothetical protein